MSKFKVGDIVTGIPGLGYYGITNEFSKCVVLGIIETLLISVKVISHEKSETYIGEIFPVDPSHFRLIAPLNPAVKFSHHMKRVEERHLKRTKQNV